MTITCPPGITTGTWDVNIVDWPWVTSQHFSIMGCVGAGYPAFTFNNGAGVQPAGNVFFQATGQSTTNTLGGLQAFAGPTGACLSPFMTIGNVVVSGSRWAVNTLSLPSNYVSGTHRVYAKGFEVHNTTAELYRGGSVLAYRTETPHTEDAISAPTDVYTPGSPGAFIESVSHKQLIIDGPPGTLASALLLPQSKQWGAEEGCYVTSALHDPTIGVYNQEAMSVFLYDSTSTTNAVSPTPTPLQFASQCFAVSGAPFPGTVWTQEPLPIGEFDISGAYFSGLTPQTTLTINWNVYVQRYPTNGEPDLVVLANPACQRENVALEFYSHAVNSLPPGVPVKENGLGDWFKDVISTAGDFVAPVLSAIPHPAAQGLGMAIKGVDAIANRDKYQAAHAAGAASNPSPYLMPGQMPRPLTAQAAGRQINNTLIRNRNAGIKEKNALIRAKNEEIRARKALKSAKKK